MTIDVYQRVGDTLSLATSWANLGILYKDQRNYAVAESLMQRALALRFASAGPRHVATAIGLQQLVYLRRSEGHSPDADSLMGMALDIKETVLGPDHPAGVELKNHRAELGSQASQAIKLKS